MSSSVTLATLGYRFPATAQRHGGATSRRYAVAIDMNVRRLAANDGESLRSLRLQALSDAPQAFGSTYAREVERKTADWQAWLASGATFVVENPSGQAVGLAVGRSDPRDSAVVDLMSMWVHPSWSW
jgi:hypothetical protein